MNVNGKLRHYKKRGSYVYLILTRFIKRLQLPFKGQIDNLSEIGRWIILISSLVKIENIVEIGTWNGRGSSKLIGESIQSFSKSSAAKKKVVGLEIDKQAFLKSKKNLKKYKQFYEVIYGRIIDECELNIENMQDFEIPWLKGEIKALRSAPFVLDKIPSSIDLLILDGGEFSTLQEYKILISRVRHFIILDDVKLRKGREVAIMIKNDPNLTLIWESEERNGVVIAQRISL